MGPHLIDPQLGTIDITNVPLKLHKNHRPLTDNDKKYVNRMLKDSYVFYVTTMGMYSRNVDAPAFTKRGRGAGCLLREQSRGVHMLQIYKRKSPDLVCEQMVRLEHVIFVDAFERMLLIVQSDGLAILLEFLQQSEVDEMHAIIKGIRTQTLPMRVIKRSINKDVVNSNPVRALPPVPNLLSKSDILILSSIHQRPKKPIGKVDISQPKEFIHMQHGGAQNQFTVMTDNPKLKLKSHVNDEHSAHVLQLNSTDENPFAVQCIATEDKVPMPRESPLTLNRSHLAPPPAPPRKLSVTSIASSCINSLRTASSLESIASTDSLPPPPPPIPQSAGPTPPPPPPPLLFQQTPPKIRIGRAAPKVNQPDDSLDMMSELKRRIDAMKNKSASRVENGSPRHVDALKSSGSPQTIGDVLQNALGRMRNAVDPVDEAAEEADSDVW